MRRFATRIGDCEWVWMIWRILTVLLVHETLPDSPTGVNSANATSATATAPDGSVDQFTIIAASVAAGVALLAVVVCVACSLFYARRDRKKDLRTIARGSARSGGSESSSARRSAVTPTTTPHSAGGGRQVSRNGSVIGTHDLLAAGTGVSTYSQTAYDRVPSEIGSNAALLPNNNNNNNNNYAVVTRQKTGIAAGYEGAQVLEQANAQNDLLAHGYGGGRVLEMANNNNNPNAPYKALTLADGSSTTGLPTLEL